MSRRIKTGARCRIVQSKRNTVLDPARKMKWAEDHYPKDILRKLQQYYPTWGDVLNLEGRITDIDYSPLGRYISIVPSGKPDVFIKINERWIEVIKVNERQNKKCDCPTPVLLRSGCQCGGK